MANLKKGNIFDRIKTYPKTNTDGVPSTSRDEGHLATTRKDLMHSQPWYRRLLKCLYNRSEGTVCGRTGKSWLCILTYSILYILFLSTYTMVILYVTLSMIKAKGDYHMIEKTELLTYADHGIGLSATPTDVSTLPLIWYKSGDENSYRKYIKAIDQLLYTKTNQTDYNISVLGPCGRQPYGYGDKPCILIKINKQLGWSVKPVCSNSSNILNVPQPLKEIIKSDSGKLIMNCHGYHEYDKEHIGTISYFPNPPGIDASIFPMDIKGTSPLLAIQISNFTLGMSIAVECKMWYDGGESSVNFILYISP